VIACSIGLVVMTLESIVKNKRASQARSYNEEGIRK